MANSSNVTIRLPANGGVDRPITYEELDNNFMELVNVIDEFNTSYTSLSKYTVLDISKSKITAQQSYSTGYDVGVEDVFTVSGENLTVPTTTIIFNSYQLEIPPSVNVTMGGYVGGGIRAQIKGYNAAGVQVVGSVDTDFIVNGSNRSFETSPSFAPVSNSESSLSISFTQDGLSKATYFTISIQSSGLSTLEFNRLLIRG